MYVDRYRACDPNLPDIGWANALPRTITDADREAIAACDHGVGLGIMLGAARSYWSTAGGIVIAAAAAGGFALYGMTPWAAASLAGMAGAALATIEARRRARQWEGLIEGRLAEIAAGR